jgi:cytochrome c oxidase subunit 2
MADHQPAPFGVRATKAPGSVRPRTRLAGAAGAAAVATVLLGGCGGGNDQSTLDPASSSSHTIAQLWWLMFIGAAVIFAVVVMLMLAAIVRRRGRPDDAPSRAPSSSALVVTGGVILPLVVLVALFALAVHAMPSTAAGRASGARLTVQVVGRQWFWQIHYPAQHFSTANELHIPVGQPVTVEVATADVIHSFWVPELNRKIDMIPGQRNAITLEADRPGIYGGQCAEFCGLQHAQMAFLVIADEPAQFARWLRAQERPAAAPATAAAARGRSVFETTTCGACHTIAGTTATGVVGPDLTHVASRSLLAAGAILNTPQQLAAWVRSPQHVKPGAKMPPTQLSAGQLQDLDAYLETLR